MNRDGHVEVAKGYYSVPPEYLSHQVWVRWNSRLVRVFNQRFEQIAAHARVPPGRFNTSWAHIADEKISGVERGAEYLLSKAARIGRDAAAWARAMLDARGIEGVRVLQGFVGLAKKHPAHVINRASSTALKGSQFRLRPLRALVKHYADQTPPELTEEHEIIRPLAEYQQLFPVSFKPFPERIEDESTTPNRSETAETLRTAFHPGSATGRKRRAISSPTPSFWN